MLFLVTGCFIILFLTHPQYSSSRRWQKKNTQVMSQSTWSLTYKLKFHIIGSFNDCLLKKVASNNAKENNILYTSWENRPFYSPRDQMVARAFRQQKWCCFPVFVTYTDEVARVSKRIKIVFQHQNVWLLRI